MAAVRFLLPEVLLPSVPNQKDSVGIDPEPPEIGTLADSVRNHRFHRR